MSAGDRVHQVQAKVHRVAAPAPGHLGCHGPAAQTDHVCRGNGKQAKHIDGELRIYVFM